MIKALMVSGDREAVAVVTRTVADYCPDATLLGTEESIQAAVQILRHRDESQDSSGQAA